MEIEYFLKKGKSYKHSDYEEKVVVHTNSIGFSFTNLSTVITSM
jgi:ribosomal protein L31